MKERNSNDVFDDQLTHECTSWIVMPNLTGGKYMMIHKNRDADSSHLQLVKANPEGKNAWISISDLNSGLANAGVNSHGLAIAMNSGDPTDFFSGEEGLCTPAINKDALENCATADEASARIHDTIIRKRNYRHNQSGSIWFIGDSRKAYILENDAVHFAAHEVKTDFAIRANAWHYPELIVYSKRTPADLTRQHHREFAVRNSLFAGGTKYNEPVNHEKVAVASRIDVIPEDPECYPLCGRRTNSGTTLRLDCEYPALLSTMFAAFGPPRYTPYLPVPFLLDDLPEELTDGSFCDAVFARREAKRELLPQDELIKFERSLNTRHDEAVEKARALLKQGGSRDDVKKLLGKAFRLNWEAVRTLSEGK